MRTSNLLIALAALPLTGCAVSLDYTDMSEEPTLRSALWIVETLNLPDSLGGGQAESEAFLLTDSRSSCDDYQTYQQDTYDLDYGTWDTNPSEDQEACDQYRSDYETLQGSRYYDEWAMTIAMSAGGPIEDGSKELGGVGGFSLSLIHLSPEYDQTALDALGDDCTGDEDVDWEDEVTYLVADDGEAEFTESGDDAWDVTLTRIELRESGDDDDEGMIEGDFSAEKCEVEIHWPEDATE